MLPIYSIVSRRCCIPNYQYMWIGYHHILLIDIGIWLKVLVRLQSKIEKCMVKIELGTYLVTRKNVYLKLFDNSHIKFKRIIFLVRNSLFFFLWYTIYVSFMRKKHLKLLIRLGNFLVIPCHVSHIDVKENYTYLDTYDQYY